MTRSPLATKAEMYFVVADGDGDRGHPDSRINPTLAPRDLRECSVLSPHLAAASDTCNDFLLLSTIFTWLPGLQSPLVRPYLSGCSLSVSFADPASSP